LSESGYGLKVDELILSAEYDFPVDDWENISEDAKDIVTKMIEPDTDVRLSAEEVLDHPWLGVRSPTTNSQLFVLIIFMIDLYAFR
jgi:serine/threonine protein kinase